MTTLTRKNILYLSKLDKLVEIGVDTKLIGELTGLTRTAIQDRLHEMGYHYDRKAKKWKKDLTKK